MNDPYYKVGLEVYMELQMLEIDEHKYYLSQKYNYDVGYNTATMSFITQGYAKKFRDSFVNHHIDIELCKDIGELETLLKNHDCNKLHEILKDL